MQAQAGRCLGSEWLSLQAQQLTSRSFLVVICIPLTQDGGLAAATPPGGTAATPPAGTAAPPGTAARAGVARPKPKPKAKVMKAVMKVMKPKPKKR